MITFGYLDAYALLTLSPTPHISYLHALSLVCSWVIPHNIRDISASILTRKIVISRYVTFAKSHFTFSTSAPPPVTL